MNEHGRKRKRESQLQLGFICNGQPDGDRRHLLELGGGLGPREVVVGRNTFAFLVDESNGPDVSLISRSHCRLTLTSGGKVVLQDLALNSTYVNGRRVGGDSLANRDRADARVDNNVCSSDATASPRTEGTPRQRVAVLQEGDHVGIITDPSDRTKISVGLVVETLRASQPSQPEAEDFVENTPARAPSRESTDQQNGDAEASPQPTNRIIVPETPCGSANLKWRFSSVTPFLDFCTQDQRDFLDLAASEIYRNGADLIHQRIADSRQVISKTNIVLLHPQSRTFDVFQSTPHLRVDPACRFLQLDQQLTPRKIGSMGPNCLTEVFKPSFSGTLIVKAAVWSSQQSIRLLNQTLESGEAVSRHWTVLYRSRDIVHRNLKLPGVVGRMEITEAIDLDDSAVVNRVLVEKPCRHVISLVTQAKTPGPSWDSRGVQEMTLDAFSSWFGLLPYVYR